MNDDDDLTTDDPVPGHPVPEHPVPKHPVPDEPVPEHPVPDEPAPEIDQAGRRGAASRRTLLTLGGLIGVGAVGGAVAVARRPRVRGAVPVGRQMPTFAAAAAAAVPVASAAFAGTDLEGHLLRRVTLGVHAEDRADLARMGIDAWIDAQLQPQTIDDPVADELWSAFPLAGASPAAIKAAGAEGWQAEVQTAQATVLRQLVSRRQLYENVVDLMSAQLHIQLPGDYGDVSCDYVATVLRGDPLGRYADTLRAAMRHPAMLLYLNNDVSTKEHVNENLGRELLELHTVGVHGGYTEDDVVASARLLTGRSLDWETEEFDYQPDLHWTGPVAVLGFTSPNATADGGLQVGDEFLEHLAHHPSTARMIGHRVAVRLVTDDPSEDLVDRLAQAYLDADTEIRAVVAAALRSTDFWSAVGTRTRRPIEDLAATFRALGITVTDPLAAAEGLDWQLVLGHHTPYGWVAPDGYPDVADSWLDAGAMVQRWNLHRVLVAGWLDGIRVPAAADLVATQVPDAAAWVGELALVLTGCAPSEHHVGALLDFAGVQGADPPTAASERAADLAALLLDSVYLQLR